MGVHGGAYRFADDLGDQKLNGTYRKEIVFTGYGFREADLAPQIQVVRENEERTRPTAVPSPDRSTMLDLATDGDNIQLYTRILKGDGADPPTNAQEIGETMAGQSGGVSSSGIPAAFTYFGQFLAHDVSHMAWDNVQQVWTNRRGHALELETLFHSDVCTDASTPHCVRDNVGLGQTNPAILRNQDLPRLTNGAPCVADARSDSNPGVAQMHVAIARFHHAVVNEFPLQSADARKRITRQHVQQIVLFDYLKRVVPCSIWNSVITLGRQIIAPSQITDGVFYIPIEFAVACFRFGHSMVRDQYDHWRFEPRTLENLLFYTHNPDGPDGLSYGNRQHLAWTPEWSRMVEGDPMGPAPLESAAVDLRLATRLGSLERRRFMTRPGEALPPFVNLAEKTLLRGYEVNLPTAQALGAHMSIMLGVPEGTILLSSSEIATTSIPALNPLLQTSGLHEATPLWLYTLREAEQVANAGGVGLGPIAGRIVMETLHAAVEAAQDSIVADYVDGVPKYAFGGEMAAGGDFTLASLIEISNSAPDLCA